MTSEVTVHLSILFAVEPPLMATSLQWPFFWGADSPYIDSCFNLSTMATFVCPQGGQCREVQLQSLFTVKGGVS